jgi:uncharacterized membrane protein
MDKINWKQKLSSRKFWAAVIAWLTSVCTAFGVTDNTIARVVAIASGVGACAVYMLAESIADHGRSAATVNTDGK